MTKTEAYKLSYLALSEGLGDFKNQFACTFEKSHFSNGEIRVKKLEKPVRSFMLLRAKVL